MTTTTNNTPTTGQTTGQQPAAEAPKINAAKLIISPDHSDDATITIGGVVMASTKSAQGGGSGGATKASTTKASGLARGEVIRLVLTHKVVDRRAGRTVMERIWAATPNMSIVRSRLAKASVAKEAALFLTTCQIAGVIGGNAAGVGGIVTKSFTFGSEVLCDTVRFNAALNAFRWPAGGTFAGQPLSADAVMLLMELCNPIMYAAGMVASDDYSAQFRYQNTDVGVPEMVNDSISRHAHVAVTDMKIGIEPRTRITGNYLGGIIARKLRTVGYAIIDTTVASEIVTHVVAGVGAYLDRTEGNHYATVPIEFRNHPAIAELSGNSTFALAALDATSDFQFTMTTADAIVKLEGFIAALKTSERYDIVSYASLIKAYGINAVDTKHGKRAFVTVHQDIRPDAVGMTVLSAVTGTANSRHIVPTSSGASQTMVGYYNGMTVSPCDSAEILRAVVDDIVDSDAVDDVQLPLVRVIQPPVCGSLMTISEMALALCEELYVVPRRDKCIDSAQYVHGRPHLLTSRALTGYHDSGLFYTDSAEEVVFVSSPQNATYRVVPGEQLISDSALRSVVTAGSGKNGLTAMLVSTQRSHSYTFDVLGNSIETVFETRHLPGMGSVTEYSSTVVPWYNAAIFQAYTTELAYASSLVTAAENAVVADPQGCAKKGLSASSVANLRIHYANSVASQLLETTAAVFPHVRDIVTRRAMQGASYASSEAIEIALARSSSKAYMILFTSTVMQELLKLNSTMLPGMVTWADYLSGNEAIADAIVTQLAFREKKWTK